MNVANLPAFGFKEFEALLPNRRYAAMPAQFSAPEIRSNPQIGLIDTSRSPFGNLNNSRSFGDYQRFFKPLGLSGRSGIQNSENTSATTSKLSYQSRLINKSKQSTELTITTRDGDTVTLKIREKSVEKERNRVNISANGDGTNGREEASVKSKSKERSSESFDLSAYFDPEKGEVSDVSFEKQWQSRTSDRVSVSSDNDGIEVNAYHHSKTYNAGSLEFEVDGTLDAGELEAIGNLIQGVDKLSAEFFDGNITKAFEQATKLGYDSSEIAGYALELKEREVSIEEQRFRSSQELERPELPKGAFRSIGNYAQHLIDLDEINRSIFDNDLLQKLMQRVDENRARDDDDEDDDDNYDGQDVAQAEGRVNRSFQQFSLELFQQIQSLRIYATT